MPAPSSQQPLPANEDLPALKTAAAAALAYVLPILDAFNHRHRNQHSAAHWWSAFSILRRRSRALELLLQRDLEASKVRAVGLGGSGGSSGGSKNKAAAKRSKVSKDGLAIIARARWIGQFLVPRCYLSFSQLAADNQHAPLGLLLLSILAHLHAALSPLAPVPDEHVPDTIRAANASQQDSALSSGAAPENRSGTPAAGGQASAADRGVAISRAELAALRSGRGAHTPRQPEKPYTREPPVNARATPIPAGETSPLPPVELKQRQRGTPSPEQEQPASNKGHVGLSKMPSLEPMARIKSEQPATEREKKRAKKESESTDKDKAKAKKKKKKHSDALSSLFGSLA